jgi:hypothetical protein
MARFRRINVDGDSRMKTETRLAAAALLPGTFAYIDGTTDEFTQATAPRGRLYVVDNGYHQGLGVNDAIPDGDSVVGNYVEEGREFAVRFAASTALKKDDPITVTAGGLGLKATEGGAVTIIGYSQETVTLAAGSTDLVRIRGKYFAAVAP